MKRECSALTLILTLVPLIIAGCGRSALQPTAVPTSEVTEIEAEQAHRVASARDAALAHVREHYADQAPEPGLDWTEGFVTAEGIVGSGTRQYTAGDWLVIVSYPIARPDLVIYRVVVTNVSTGFRWDGRVDAADRVTESPEAVVSARDIALAHVRERHGEEAPPLGLVWEEEPATPEGLVGAGTYVYASAGWLVTVSYPVVRPDLVVYEVVVTSDSTGFRWDGRVDAGGQVSEAPREVIAARDVAVAFVSERYGETAPALDLHWAEEFVTPEGMVGSGSYEYVAEDWTVTVSYPIVPPESIIFRIVVMNERTGFRWLGLVDAAGDVTETLAPSGGLPVVGWYGRIIGTPDGAQYDDHLLLEPEGTGVVGLAGTDEALEAAIAGLRDSATYAHLWGILSCDVPDYGACQLLVTRLRIDGPGPFFDPDPVECWEGTVVGTPAMAQYDDYFVLSGDFPVRYGIDSTDPAVAAQLSQVRDTGSTIRVWGRVRCGIMDVNGSRIEVIFLDVVD